MQTAFSEGDEVATGILRGAADELESAGVSVARRLGMGEARFRSSWPAASSAPCRGFATSCSGGCRSRSPNSTARLLDREPAAGAVSFALQEAKGGARIPRYQSE